MVTEQPRRSIFATIAPVTNTYDELLKKKLEAGKFPFTKTGVIKILGIMDLVAALALFLAKPSCAETSTWYPYLFPIFIGAALLFEIILYLIFSFGGTTKCPGLWVKTDILGNMILLTVAIICAAITMTDCRDTSTIQTVPCPLGMVGCIILIIGCIALFLMYRYVEDEERQPKNVIPNPRKSIFA